MPDDDESRTTAGFTARKQWSIVFTLGVYMAAVLALVVMANYLAGRHFAQLSVSAESRDRLSPKTLELLRSITNQVRVTVYFTRDNALWTPVSDVLKEYKDACPRISVSIVNYLTDPGAADQVRARYHLSSREDRDMVIFDGNGVTNIVDAKRLAEYEIKASGQSENGEPEYTRTPKLLNFELRFDSALLGIISPRHLNAYFLAGHQEHAPDNDEPMGYSAFAGLLERNSITSRTLSLLGTNQVPLDCNLLIIAGPATALSDSELAKIDQYLNEGGRLFVLFKSVTEANRTGLEDILAKWNLSVDIDQVFDPENKVFGDFDFATTEFGNHSHPLVNSLIGGRLHVVTPRSIRVGSQDPQNADTPEATMLVYTSPRGQARFPNGQVRGPAKIPFIAAVEKGKVKGVPTQRGLTRIVAAGDSIFLDNNMIVSVNNMDFAGLAINWLVDQTLLLPGVGPTRALEYRVEITSAQMQRVELLLLGGLPGATLVLGGLVWLRRRH